MRARPKLVALRGLLVYTGLRRDEIRRLAWENINLSDWSITINGKGNKPRTIPVHPDLREILRDLPDRNAYTNPELREGPVLWTEQTHKEYAEGRSFEKLKLRITDRPFHAFRKTVGTSLGRNGVRTEDIKRILGWAASDIFQKHYYSVNLDDLHRAILRLYATTRSAPSRRRTRAHEGPRERPFGCQTTGARTRTCGSAE